MDQLVRMPWDGRTVSELRGELVVMALKEGANISELSRRYGVSRQTAYKWISRYLCEGEAGLSDRRRPDRCPNSTPSHLEERIVALRLEHPAWGARKIRALMLGEGLSQVPSASTVTQVLRRSGLLGGVAGSGKPACERFEREGPNELWQLDFKGHFATLSGRCHPLTLLDDYSRFCLGAWACSNEREDTVRPLLVEAFRRWGLPPAVLCDNGGPWSGHGRPCSMELWLARLGVRVLHGKPYHPQTQGKLERMHRTLLAEAIPGRSFADLRQCQERLDRWRDEYNRLRPHEALGMVCPASRYRPSPRQYPEKEPEPFCSPDETIRMVQKNGWVSFLGRELRLGDALVGQPVSFAAVEEQVWQVRYCGLALAQVDLRQSQTLVTYTWGVNHVSGTV